MTTKKKKSLLKQILAIFLITALVIPQGYGLDTAYAAISNKVTFTEQLYSYYPDGTRPVNNQHGLFKGSLNDNPIFCGNHSKPSPVGETIGDSKTLTMHEYNSKVMIDKILYYGYGGPKQWLGFNDSEYYSPYKGGTTAKKKQWMGISVTSMSLTRAYGGAGYWYNISGLPEFWEYVKDADAPPNGFQTYIMYGNDNEQDLFTFIYEPEAYLTLDKSVTKETGDSIKGAEYGVYSDSDLTKKVGTLKTKEDGSTNTLTLKPGTYYVKETKAPKGWRIDTEKYKAKLTEDKTTTIKSKEEPEEGYGKLLKGIAKNNHLVAECPEHYSLAGAEYGVYNSRNDAQENYKRLGALTTKADGSTNTLILKPGTYYVRETKSPKGFELDTTIYDMVIQDAKTTTLKVSDKPKFDPMTLVLTKVDKEGTGMPIEGAEFTVKYYKQLFSKLSDAKSLTPAKTWVLKTDKNGLVRLLDSYKVGGDTFYVDENGKPVGLIGTYVFTETKAPIGYATVKEPILRQVTESGVTGDKALYVPFTVDEYPQTVSITLQKVDAETGQAVPQGLGSFEGAKYEVRDSNDQSVGTITTDKNGKGSLTDLKPGTYTVREIKAPKGYLVNKEVITVAAKIKEINTANFDYKIESKETATETEFLKYEVIDGQKVPVEGATLQVISEDGTVVKEFITTDSAYVLKGLAVGKYVLHEKKTPAGYVTAADVEFEVKEGEEVRKVEMEDDIIKVEINKLDKSTKNMMDGATLQIIDSSGKVVDEWVSTDKTHRIDRLPKGVYTLHEVSAPAGYVVAEDITFEVIETGDVQTFTIENGHTEIEIFKVDKVTRDIIPGTVLSVIPLDDEGNPKVGETFATMMTNTEGKIVIDYIPEGKYMVKEVRTNFEMGYVTAEDMVIEVKNTTDLQTFTMEDDHTKVEITKTDIVTGEPVIGAQLSVIPLDENGNPKLGEIWATWITTEDPYYIEYMPVGDYILREIVAPFDNGYVTAADVKFTVEDTGIIQKVEMNDDHTKVEITKTDKATGEPVVGAILSIIPLDENGNIKLGETWATWVTTEDPYYTEFLPAGDYILREISAPYEQGYVKAEDILFTVKDTDQVQHFEMQDDFTKVEILKVDSDTGKPLENAEFELYNEEKEKVEEWLSAKEPKRFEGLPIGKYLLIEKEAPEGYIPIADSVEIEIQDTEDVQKFEIDNRKSLVIVPKIFRKYVPKTGEDGNLGKNIIISVVGLIIVIIVKKKTKV